MVASESNPIILYDFKSNTPPHRTWNVNIWKTRLLLNYKKLAYKTIWISLCDTQSILAKRGFPAPPPGGKYTLPAIEDPSSEDDGQPTLIYDSYKIAEYLEAKYPESPRVFPKGTEALQALWYDHFVANILVPTIVVPWVLTVNVISDDSVEYISNLIELAFKKTPMEVDPKGEEREKIFQKLETEYGKVIACVEKNSDGGIFIGGKEPVFADFQLIAHVVWLQRVLPAEEWAKVSGWHDGHWEKLRKASEAWCQIL